MSLLFYWIFIVIFFVYTQSEKQINIDGVLNKFNIYIVITVSLTLLAIMILYFIGMGYATKVAFTSENVNGKYCSLSQVERNITRFTLIIYWILLCLPLVNFFMRRLRRSS